MTMPDRRTFLGLAAATLLPLDADAQAPPASSGAAELARHALSGPLEAFEVVLVELNNPPAAAGGQAAPNPGHRHPGPVLGYIVEGQMRFGVNHEPEKVLPVGATFFEPTGTLHTGTGSASTSARARAVVFMIVPKGAPLVVPA